VVLLRAGLVGAGLVGSGAGAGPAAAETSTTYYVSTIGGSQPAAARTLSRAAVDAQAGSGQMSAATVDGGFYLQGNNRVSSWLYRSDEKDAILYRCNSSGCTEAGRIGLKIKQTVYGGGSTGWLYDYSYNYKSGPGYTAYVHYECARNIKAAPDKYCYEYSDRPTAGEGYNLQVTPITFDRSWSRSYSFGTATGAKKYAQLLLQVTWPSVKVTVDGKFRSWDTKRFSANDAHLESSTGTGR
jgi:hypothetical protein